MLHKIYTSLITILSLALLGHTAQAQEHKVILKAADGATRVNLRLTIDKDQTATINWGDGQTEVAEANKGVNGTLSLVHTYATALTTESPFIEISSEHLIAIQDNYNGNIRGFVSLDAPKLITASFLSSNSYQHPKLDLSKCPLIETLGINNINELILPPDCKLKNIRITAGDGYGTSQIVGSARYIPAFAAEQCPLLEKIEMMNSILTSIDLSQSPNVYHLDLAFSKSLREIKGIKALSKLKVSKLNYCALGYDQIPDKTTDMTDTNYKYESQGAYVIPEGRVNELTVDLSHIYKVKGIADEEKTTTFEWKIVGLYTGTPIPTDKIKAENGVFTFDASILGDKEAVSVYVVMTNEGLPNIGSGFGTEKYKSENITLSKNAVKTFKLNYGVNGTGGKVIAKTSADDTSVMTGADLIEDTEVVVTAIPDKGMRVKEWTLDNEVIADFTGLKLKHTMVADAIIKVSFEPITHLLTFEAKELSTTMGGLRAEQYAIEAKLDNQVLTSPATIPTGAVVRFTATATVPYYVSGWFGGEESIREEAAHTSTATLDVTVVSDTTISAQFINTTSIEEILANDQSVHIYPNPAIDYTQVEVANILIGQKAYLIDLTGCILRQFELKNTNRLELSALAQGTYFLRIGNKAYRIILQ